MNNLWIGHSHESAEYVRDDFLDNSVDDLKWFEYLDVIGCFETSWMIYEFHPNKIEYGYPNEQLMD